jgi:hypothetical protein
MSPQAKYIGKCIYCPKPGTTKEHVVPIFAGGQHILLKASCDECQKITGGIETKLCEQNFDALRFHQGYRGRREISPKKRDPDMKVMTTGGTRLEPKFRKSGRRQGTRDYLISRVFPAGNVDRQAAQ